MLNSGNGRKRLKKTCGSTSRWVVSKPGKATGARGQSKARGAARTRSVSGAKPAGASRSASSKSRTKAELEQELAELKKINADLREQVRRQEARAQRLEQINEEAGQRIDSVIGRIKTLLAS